MATTGRGGGSSSGKSQRRKRADSGAVQDNLMNHEGVAALEAREKTFALAVAVIQERIQSLRSDDRQDLMEVIPFLFCDDPEEVAAAQKAVHAILNQTKASVLPDSAVKPPNDALVEWLNYISARIRDLRGAARMTQKELAVRSGLPQSHISRLENGQHSPSHKTLVKIAKALEVSLGDLDPTEPRRA
jgi:DNA-binding XRE family transcriptional regulator